MSAEFDEKLTKDYVQLSNQQQEVCYFIEKNPVDIVSRPLLSVAQAAVITPTVFFSVAAALVYGPFCRLFDSHQGKTGAQDNSFTNHAHQIQLGVSFAQNQTAAFYGNLDQLIALSKLNRITTV